MQKSRDALESTRPAPETAGTLVRPPVSPVSLPVPHIVVSLWPRQASAGDPPITKFITKEHRYSVVVKIIAIAEKGRSRHRKLHYVCHWHFRVSSPIFFLCRLMTTGRQNLHGRIIALTFSNGNDNEDPRSASGDLFRYSSWSLN